MNPQVDKLVRWTTTVATVTVSYFLLTADYGPEPNVLDPVKNAILSAQRSVKEIFVGPDKGNPKDEKRGKPEESNTSSSSSKGNP